MNISVRGILFSSLVVGGISAFVVANSSKEKKEYTKSTGRIEYLGKTYQHLPTNQA
ncbi:MAG: hypothetical protein AAF551_07155 [Bacteroidota bacterium]